MKTEFTPGQWAVTPKIGTNSFIVYSDLGENELYNVCYLNDEYNSLNETKANARLIAAAPELLEACEKVLPYLGALGTNGLHWVSVIESAINKAKGITQPEKV